MIAFSKLNGGNFFASRVAIVGYRFKQHQAGKRDVKRHEENYVPSSVAFESAPSADSEDSNYVRITTPQRMDDSIRRRLVARQLSEAETERRRRLGTPIVACTRPAYNLYKGRQMYSKDVPLTTLASHGWKHPRSKSDSFTINAFSDRSFYFTSETKTDNENGNESRPTCSFGDFSINPVIVERLKTVLNIERATNVQELVVPQILSGKNVQFAAENGSGKTLAYLVPLLELAMRERWNMTDDSKNQLKVVILAPSRELGRQIASVADRLVGAVDGGSQYLRPKLMLEKLPANYEYTFADNFNMVISTPSCFLRKFSDIDTSAVRRLVIDEADTLLDDSFAKHVKGIFEQLSNAGNSGDHPEKQTQSSQNLQVILASATLPLHLQEVIGRFLPVDDMTSITTNRLNRLAAHISHKFVRCGPSQKTDLVVKLARKVVGKRSPTIIFCNRSPAVAFIVKLLIENGLPAEEIAALDGRLIFDERDAQWDAFSSGKKTLLVATDLASRGLDTPHVRHVVNFDLPRSMSDYIHRAGRMGRVSPANSNKGSGGCLVTNLVTYQSDVELVWQLESAARRSAIGNPQPLPDVDANIKRHLREVSEQRQAKMKQIGNPSGDMMKKGEEPPFPRKFLGENYAGDVVPPGDRY